MTIAVTGASGQLGRRAAELLLDAVAPGEVVLITRSPDGLADLAARGADVRHGDFGVPGSLPDAFAGVDRVLLISTDVVGQRVEGHRAAITAAATAGVRHIAYTSIPQPVADNPAAVVPDHAATEEALRDSGVAWTFLRNNLYADMQVQVVQRAAAAGQLVANTGDGGTAYVARGDCAAAAIGVLTGDGHEGQAYDITGPEALTAYDLAALAGEVSGGPVEVVTVDDQAYVDGIVSAGMPAAVAQMLASFGAAGRLGYLDRVSTAVRDLTGREATALRDLVIGAAG
ncbi:MAG TPA: SDR family oxidoreductase [Euzebyales bacterium]